MKPTELRQEIRKMRFEEAYGGWSERRLTQAEAARLLGVVTVPFAAILIVTMTLRFDLNFLSFFYLGQFLPGFAQSCSSYVPTW